MTDADLIGPILLSFKLAALTTVILIAIATPLAWWLAFSRSPLKLPVEVITTLPLVLRADGPFGTAAHLFHLHRRARERFVDTSLRRRPRGVQATVHPPRASWRRQTMP